MKMPFFGRMRPEFSYLSLADFTVALFGIMLFTVSVMPTVTSASSYFDEGYSAYLAKLDIISMAAYTAQDVHPPLYYAALHTWHSIVGDGIVELRFLSVVFAWIAMIFGFLIMRRWFNRQAAWLAIGLMALSPLFIRYGSAMRMYTMALAIAFAATYVLLLAVHQKSRRLWALYAFLVAAGMWTNYFMVLVWITHSLWLLYEYHKNNDIMAAWRKAFIGAVVLYLPWLPWLLIRYSEIQADGFWIKPISIDTLTSMITQNIVFRSATDTTSWLAIGVLSFIVTLAVVAPRAYKNLNKQQASVFRLIVAMSSLPVILLAVGSLPPLRPSFTFRYTLVAAISVNMLVAIILIFAKFKKHQLVLKIILISGTVSLVGSGAIHAIAQGNRSLDTSVQNKLGQTMQAVFDSKRPAPIVLRSPYSYYTASLYTSQGYETYFIFSNNLARVGSTKPLYDHRQNSILNFDAFDKVWLVGEDIKSIVAPASGKWVMKDRITKHDDISHKVAAAAAYYERTEY